MDTVPFLPVVGFALLFWIGFSTYRSLAKAQREWGGLLDELERSARDVNERAAEFAGTVRLRKARPVSGHLN